MSTRKVKNITEEPCRHEFSSSTVSRVVQKLDEEIEAVQYLNMEPLREQKEEAPRKRREVA